MSMFYALNFVLALYRLYLWKYGHYALVNCSSQCDCVPFSCFRYAYLRPRKQSKVIRFSLKLSVSSISALHVPQEGFSLNFRQILISVRLSAEPLNQLCRCRTQFRSCGLTFTLLSAHYILGSNLGLCEPKLRVTSLMASYGNAVLKQQINPDLSPRWDGLWRSKKQFRALSNVLLHYQIQFACDCVRILQGVIKKFLG